VFEEEAITDRRATNNGSATHTSPPRAELIKIDLCVWSHPIMISKRQRNLLSIMFLLLRVSRPLMVSALPSSAFNTAYQRPAFLLASNRHFFQTSTRLSLKGDDVTDTTNNMSIPEPMVNLYQEWTPEQDQMLWDYRRKTPVELASILGRGLNGVQARLSKLKDVDSPAYERLFSQKSPKQQDQPEASKEKLVPASEVLRRVQWDYMLKAEDFSILHYDRVDEEVVESRMDAPNGSISGGATTLMDALPEHRIVGIKYKERVVWDREKRMDLVFSNGGIIQVMEEYDEWKTSRDAAIEWNKQRQAQISAKVEQILGTDRYAQFKGLSKELQSAVAEVETYVKQALRLYREARQDPVASTGLEDMPMTDLEALESLSELVALLPDSLLRPAILAEISLAMDRLEGNKKSTASSLLQRELPDLDEDDLTETFVRGSGPGGQKVNKTSNRVLLVHEPTQLRVECQDTRSLTQNRKIARKRLRMKLDDYLNGSQSKASIKAQKASSKKAKAKVRSRSRQRKKQEASSEDSDDA
jgi:uncharacterized protein (UPF0248 family)